VQLCIVSLLEVLPGKLINSRTHLAANMNAPSETLIFRLLNSVYRTRGAQNARIQLCLA